MDYNYWITCGASLEGTKAGNAGPKLSARK